MTSATARKTKQGLSGVFPVPGDKSISHRSLIFAALAEGVTEIYGLLESDDVLHTADALQKMGILIEKEETSEGRVWRVTGGKLTSPKEPLYLGNSGTSARLLAGVIAGQGVTACITGDESLSRRPMARVTEPLSKMGAKFRQENEDTALPLWIEGVEKPRAITYNSPVASAQVKSAILLAGLNAEGETCVREPGSSRDHTERMLEAFGIDVETGAAYGGGSEAALKGGKKLVSPGRIDVPADPSSAAFPAVAALITKKSFVVLPAVSMNPTRAGLYKILKKMGADIELKNETMLGGEPVADLHIRAGEVLKGCTVPAVYVPAMIDEYPILAVAASVAEGITRMEGLAELRVKESNRLEKIASGLKACGVRTEIDGDDLIVYGRGNLSVMGGVTIETGFDHRIAMSFLVLGGVTREPITIDRADAIATSFPTFIKEMNKRGCDIRLASEQAHAFGR
ncbi:MAG: 3-phosphoshikimate 1-carboxyvinyltransferase [Alphaproteobacteria bacterium]|nr:MAG: 3-phosphoshikimate 1-carboxyvinyltransferase [Alphaproteobacteria bacterium]